MSAVIQRGRRLGRGETLAVAHRGEPIGQRENTPGAFAAALRAGADMVELDCRLTGDDQVVVLHDASLTRLWGCDAAVADLAASEMTALGEGDCRVPLLGEVLATIDSLIMVDVADPAVMPAALREVEAARALPRCIFAGHLDGLRWLRSANDLTLIALSWEEQRLPTTELLGEIAPLWFNPRFDLLDETVIDEMHRAGVGVSAWTVDDVDVMSCLAAAGIDAIITNRIADLVTLLRERRDGGEPGDMRLSENF